MELPCKLLEQYVFNTRRSKIEEDMSIVMDKSTHEEHLSQIFQTNNKQLKIAVTFLTGYNGIFKVTGKINQFYFSRSPSGETFLITIPRGSYEIESLNNEIKRIIIDEGHLTETDYTFQIKPNFSTLGSLVEVSSQGPTIRYLPNDSIRDLLGFKPKVLQEEYNLSDYPVDTLSFDNFFIETDFAQGMIFKGKRTGIIHNFTNDVDLGYKYIEKLRGGVQWYMMESKDIFSSICFKLRNENIQLVSFNGQSISFRLSIKEI